jgi:hypothetical protein
MSQGFFFVAFHWLVLICSFPQPVVIRAEMKLNATLLAVLAASVFSFAHADDSHPGTQSQVLLKTTRSWDGVAYPAYPAGRKSPC